MKKSLVFIILIFLGLLFIGTTQLLAQEKKIVLLSWGGVWEEGIKKAFGDPFEKETGIKVFYTGPYDLGKLKAMVEAGRTEWDVGQPGMGWLVQAEYANLLEPIDYTVVRKEQLDPGSVHKYGVGGEYEAIAIGYRTTKYGKNPPKSWKDFWDTNKFPGPRCLPKRPDFTMELALLADGVDSAKLYPLDIDRAFKSLDRLKPNVPVWWTVGTQSQSVLKDGEVDMVATYNGRIIDLKLKGATVDIVWDQALYYQAAWCVFKGTPRIADAMKFIEFTNRPENQAIMAKHIFYGPTNPKSFNYIDKETAKFLPSYSEHFKKCVKLDFDYWRPNREKVLEQMTQWLMK